MLYIAGLQACFAGHSLQHHGRSEVFLGAEVDVECLSHKPPSKVNESIKVRDNRLFVDWV